MLCRIVCNWYCANQNHLFLFHNCLFTFITFIMTAYTAIILISTIFTIFSVRIGVFKIWVSDLSSIYRTEFFFKKSKCFQQPVSKESTSPLNLFQKLTKRDTTKTKKRNIENLFERVMTYFLLINADNRINILLSVFSEVIISFKKLWLFIFIWIHCLKNIAIQIFTNKNLNIATRLWEMRDCFFV